jgi:hypothetical protein
MSTRAKIAFAVSALAALILSGRRTAFGGPSVAPGVDRSEDKLAAPFRAKVGALFARLRSLGFDPFLWEGYRSPERAAELAAKHVGIAKSLHINGCAVDIVDATKLWDADPAFWRALQREAEALGLTSGAHWGDRDHVQAIPVHQEPALRTAPDVTAYLVNYYARNNGEKKT